MLHKDRKKASERTLEEAFNDFQSWIEAPPTEQVMHTVAGHVLRGYKRWPEEVVETWLPMAEAVMSHFPKPVGCPEELLQDYAVPQKPYPPFRLFRLLRLFEQHIRAHEMTLVFGHPDLCHIETVMLIDMRIDDAAIQAMLEACAPGQLKVLDLQHNCITDFGAQLLSSSTKLGALTHLSIFHNQVGESGIKALLQPGGLGALERLSIGCQDGLSVEALLKQLGDAVLPKTLVELRLEHSNFTDEQARRLAEIPALAQLDELHLTGNELRESTLTYLRESTHLSDTAVQFEE